MVEGGQGFPRELRVSRSFIPAHSGYGVIVLPLRVIARAPGGRSWPSGLVYEAGHGLVPRYDLTRPDEFVLPVLAVPVSARADELLVLLVGDLVLVDEEIGQRSRACTAGQSTHHR